MGSILHIALVFAFGVVDPEASSCEIDHSAYLAQDYETFDQSDDGWRPWAQQKCYTEVADLIETYRTENSEALDQSEEWTLVWHLAQMHAYANNYPAAIEAYEMTREINTPHYDNTRLKTDAVIAFLQRDMILLQSIRGELASLPEPEGFRAAVASAMERFPDMEPPTWPPELDTVDNYIRCFEYEYAIAYEGQC